MSVTILYFCYGDQALYEQTAFSILSLLRFVPDAGGAKVVVYCDRPEAFARLPVETVPLAQETLDAWLGASDYHHRRKTCAIIDALERYGGSVIFLDSDTYWTASPASLFRRVGPDRACFHILEGFLQSTGTPFDQALERQFASHRYHLPSGAAVTVGRRTPMWNTGVVGVHADQLHRVRDALALSDAIWADADPQGVYGNKIHHAEQFAMGYAFRDCRLSEAADCVYHYWPKPMKAAFQAGLPKLIGETLADRSPVMLDRLYAGRPRETGLIAWRDGIKMTVRRTALALGVPVRGVRRNVG